MHSIERLHLKPKFKHDFLVRYGGYEKKINLFNKIIYLPPYGRVARGRKMTMSCSPRELKIKVVQSFLDVIILSMLKDDWLSGYDIFRRIIDEKGIVLSPGTIYAKLYSLERKGLIEGFWSSRKRIYCLTQQGVKYLESISYKKEWILKLMDSILGEGV